MISSSQNFLYYAVPSCLWDKISSASILNPLIETASVGKPYRIFKQKMMSCVLYRLQTLDFTKEFSPLVLGHMPSSKLTLSRSPKASTSFTEASEHKLHFPLKAR
jgi:hypothetical protein